ncbi:MAG: RDD family protein [Luteolibacter sp.]
MMNEQNPYAAPNTDPIPAQEFGGNPGLADPGDRFVGSFVDGLVGIAIAALIWGGLLFAGVIHSMEGFDGGFDRMGIGYAIFFTIVHFSLLMAIQWKFLKATGQTIGKKVAKTRIVTMDGKKPEITDLVFKRYAFVSLINTIPVVGGFLSLVDSLLVFRKDRRCLHDLVAGTQVVKVVPDQPIS